MFPLRDGIPSRRFPAVTAGLIAINGVVFLYQLTLPDDGLKTLFDAQAAALAKVRR